MSISVLHQTARNFAQAGIPVFPCLADRKEPAVEGGFKAATTELKQIDAWWVENPNYNVAYSPEDAGWAVIDQEHDASAWINGHDWPKTWTIGTPRGGKHFIFEGSLPSTAQSLAPKVDTRGKGGYVLAPPSVVNGKPYRILVDMDPVPLPKWVPAALTKTATKTEAPPDITINHPGNVLRAIVYLKGLPATHEGDGSDEKAYKAAGVLKDMGLSPEKTIEVMMAHFKCTPKTVEWVTTKVANTFKYGENEPGAYAAKAPSEAFAEIVAELPETPAKRSRFYFEDDEEMDKTPEPRWILKDLIPEESVVLLTARKGSFKTFTALDFCLGVATGEATCTGFKSNVRGPTFYGAHEGIHHIKRNHRRAWRLAKDISGKTDFYMARGPRIGSEDDRNEFADQIRAKANGRAPCLIVLDTYSACMLGLNENDPGDANRFIAYCRELIEVFPGCSVIVPAHFGKDDTRGTRGSNALEAGVDTVLELHRYRETSLARLSVKFQRGSPEREMPFYMQGHSIAGSLVFQPLSEQKWREMTMEDLALTKKKVTSILKKCGAYGAGKAVSTRTVASGLAPMEPEETSEEWTKRLNSVERALGRASKSYLEPLIELGRKQGDLRWHLPERK